MLITGKKIIEIEVTKDFPMLGYDAKKALTELTKEKIIQEVTKLLEKDEGRTELTYTSKGEIEYIITLKSY